MSSNIDIKDGSIEDYIRRFSMLQERFKWVEIPHLKNDGKDLERLKKLYENVIDGVNKEMELKYLETQLNSFLIFAEMSERKKESAKKLELLLKTQNEEKESNKENNL